MDTNRCWSSHRSTWTAGEGLMDDDPDWSEEGTSDRLRRTCDDARGPCCRLTSVHPGG